MIYHKLSSLSFFPHIRKSISCMNYGKTTDENFHTRFIIEHLLSTSILPSSCYGPFWQFLTAYLRILLTFFISVNLHGQSRQLRLFRLYLAIREPHQTEYWTTTRIFCAYKHLMHHRMPIPVHKMLKWIVVVRSVRLGSQNTWELAEVSKAEMVDRLHCSVERWSQNWLFAA